MKSIFMPDLIVKYHCKCVLAPNKQYLSVVIQIKKSIVVPFKCQLHEFTLIMLLAAIKHTNHNLIIFINKHKKVPK